MRVLKIIRSSEWWEYKMPILLSLAYATALYANKSLYGIAGWFGFMATVVSKNEGSIFSMIG